MDGKDHYSSKYMNKSLGISQEKHVIATISNRGITHSQKLLCDYVVTGDHECGLRKKQVAAVKFARYDSKATSSTFCGVRCGRDGTHTSWWIDRQGRGSKRDHDLRTDQRSQVHTRVHSISDDLTIHCLRSTRTFFYYALNGFRSVFTWLLYMWIIVVKLRKKSE